MLRKEKKILWPFLTKCILKTIKLELQGSFVDQGTKPGPDPGGPKRPDPDPVPDSQHCWL